MERELFLSLENVEPRVYGMTFPSPINWKIKRGEQWAVVGANGAGKTMLADLVSGKIAKRNGEINYHFWNGEGRTDGRKYATESIRKVGFESAYLLADYRNMYYQQRFQATENDWSPTVEEIFSNAGLAEDKLCFWVEKLNLKPLFHKHIIMLSSGELRRFLIASVLMQEPDLIIFDNPFIGLDKETCAQLNSFFNELGKFQQMVFLVPALNEIPEVVTNILPVKALNYEKPMQKSDFLAAKDVQEHIFETQEVSVCELPLSEKKAIPFEIVADLKDVNIAYPDRVLFKDLNWTIKKGEKWALLGKNGSGKSSLLSLLAADNPKAYSQNITLFDRRRGTGESIWDIKRPIGYISSEMHLYFLENQDCLKIVSSGFFDTVGLFRKCEEWQCEIALQWMRLLGIEHLAGRSFLKVSGGEQRLVLLARTMVKNPDLLILDEPLHGLDWQNKQRARRLIELFCKQPEKTMIYVTHRREEIPSCVDKFFELQKLE